MIMRFWWARIAAMGIVVHDRVVNISGEPVAQGMSREIYTCPDAPELLYKVTKPMPAPRRFFHRSKLLSALRRRYKHFVPFMRECREYKRVASEGSETRKHLQQLKAVVQTDRGPAMLVKAVKGDGNQLGMTVKKLIEKGKYDLRTQHLMQEFLEWFESSSVVAADVHLDNIVYDENSNAMVLIDGIGDKTFIPLRAWIPILNKSYKKRLVKDINFGISQTFMKMILKKEVVASLFFLMTLAIGLDMRDGYLFD